MRGGVKRDVELCVRLRTDRHRQELRVSENEHHWTEEPFDAGAYLARFSMSSTSQLGLGPDPLRAVP
jgi:hypothetical protein